MIESEKILKNWPQYFVLLKIKIWIWKTWIFFCYADDVIGWPKPMDYVSKRKRVFFFIYIYILGKVERIFSHSKYNPADLVWKIIFGAFFTREPKTLTGSKMISFSCYFEFSNACFQVFGWFRNYYLYFRAWGRRAFLRRRT